jgi:hypothetical protein
MFPVHRAFRSPFPSALTFALRSIVQKYNRHCQRFCTNFVQQKKYISSPPFGTFFDFAYRHFPRAGRSLGTTGMP